MKVINTSFLQNSWIRGLILIFIVAGMVISAANIFPAREVKPGAPVEIFTNHLDQRIPAIMQAYQIPGSVVALVKEGKIVWINAYGYADLETGRKMTPDTYLRVQSISKSVTAWGVMKLVEQGKIDLDRPVEQYLKNWSFPNSEFSEEKITTRQLLSHTAGLPLGDVFTIYRPDQVVPSLEDSLSKEAVLMQEPGQSFSYSNTGYNFLELLIEEVTGQDFAEYMEQKIFLPLGMEHASYNWSEDIQPSVPNGYNQKGKAIPVYIYPEKGSGGLFARVEDIATFVAAEMHGYTSSQPVLSNQSIQSLHTPIAEDLGVYSLVFDSYGLGHYIETLPNGMQAISHGGQGTGIMTHYHAVPETGDGIVILTNSQRSWPFIAYILTDWAKWCGFSSLGMSRIILAIKALWIIIGILWFGVLWQFIHVIMGLIQKTRKFGLSAKGSRWVQAIQFILSVLLVDVYIWSVQQDYLFISSVLPVAADWLFRSLLAVAAVLLLSTLFPKGRCIND